MAATSSELVNFEGRGPADEPRAGAAQKSPLEPDFAIHTLDELVSDVRRRGGPLGTAASVFAHVTLVVAVIALPLLLDDSLPEPAGSVRAFFTAPLELGPPPPPPPPPAARVKTAPTVQAPEVVQTSGFVAPIETPAEIVPEDGMDFGIEGGVAGGVEGGVPGGVVGGVIGGLPEAPPAPAPGPIRVGGRIKEPTKLKSVPPVYPDAAVAARMEGVVILECMIDPRGQVSGIEVMRGAPLLEEAAIDAVRQWVYTPTLMDGVPVPVLITVTVRFDLKNT